MPTKRKKTVKDISSVNKVLKNSRSTHKKLIVNKVSENHFSKVLVLAFVFILLVFAINSIYRRLFVAKVNGQYISQIEYYKELEKRGGKDVVEDMVTKKIIFQEAEKQGINISDSEINAEVQKLREEVQKQNNTLENLLALQGMDYDDLVENIKIQKVLEKLLSNQVNITDEEVNARYEDTGQLHPEEQDEASSKEAIRLQLSQEKLASAYRIWIQQKIGESKIDYLR